MQFGDFNEAIDWLLKLAICPLIIVVVFGLVNALLTQLPPQALLGLLLLLLFLSPVAYFILESMEVRPRRNRPPRGAERTPLVPPDEEGEE